MNERRDSTASTELVNDAETVAIFNGASELFHRLNRAIPTNQQILILAPTTLARDAIKQLEENFYTQAPVVSGDIVHGVFSFRSFARLV